MDVEGNRPKARQLHEEAVAIDSTFAMAWRSLSILYTSLGPASAMVYAATRAYRHRDRLPDRERHLVTAAYYDVVTREYDKVLEAYNEQLAATPDDGSVLGAAGFMYFRLRRYEDADRLYTRSMETDSTRTAVYFGLIESRINRGRLDAARQALAAFHRRFPDNQFAEWRRSIWPRPSPTSRPSSSTPSGCSPLRRMVATIAARPPTRSRAWPWCRVTPRCSARLRRAAMRIYEQDNDLGGYFGEAIALALAEARLPAAPTRAGASSRRNSAAIRSTRLRRRIGPYAELGAVYVELGDLDRAAAMQALLERYGLNRGRMAEGKLAAAPRVDSAGKRRYLEAQAELRLAATQEECARGTLPALARSYDLGGRSDSAIRTYEGYLRTPWMSGSSSMRWTWRRPICGSRSCTRRRPARRRAGHVPTGTKRCGARAMIRSSAWRHRPVPRREARWVRKRRESPRAARGRYPNCAGSASVAAASSSAAFTARTRGSASRSTAARPPAPPRCS